MTDSWISPIKKQHLDIIRTVLYFDVFSYPLTTTELYENTALNVSVPEFNRLVDELIGIGLLQKQSDFILGVGRDQSDIEKRLNGNKGANAIMPTAYRFSSRIAAFPFVEGLCLSGALSKNYYDEQGDIDFFIITKPGRLWICRSLLILRFKLLPASKKRFWCTNYFISSEDLRIQDRNAFTATELAYLIPVFNYEAYKNLMTANDWHRAAFPNKQPAPDNNCIPAKKNRLKSLTERLLSGRTGDWLDNLLLSMTLRHWRKRFSSMAGEDFELQFRARKNVSKRHTKGFQNKVLTLWEERKKHYEQRFGISLA